MAREDFTWAWSLLVDCGLPKSPPVAEEAALRSRNLDTPSEFSYHIDELGQKEPTRRRTDRRTQCSAELTPRWAKKAVAESCR